MAAVQDANNNLPGSRHDDRSKSSALRSFIHRRNNSEGTGLPSSLEAPDKRAAQEPPSDHRNSVDVNMGFHQLTSDTRALGQGQNNRKGQIPRSPTKATHDSPKSPSKNTFASISAKFEGEKNTKESSSTKTKKPKSSTNLIGLLSRPKSSKNLNKLLAEAEVRLAKDKENRTPPGTLIGDLQPPTPIYAQFCAGAQSVPSSPFEAPEDPFSRLITNSGHSSTSSSMERPGLKQRPKSFQPPYPSKHNPVPVDDRKENRGRSTNKEAADGQRSSTWGKGRSASRGRVLTALSNIGHKSKSSSPTSVGVAQHTIDPKDIDAHLEAMLDRRNIPENQRYKMRSLTNTIKMEFIRQDWAENEAKKLEQSPTNDGDEAMNVVTSCPTQETDKKRSRGKSFTFSRNSWKLGPTSPTKSKKRESTLGRHSRHKSVDSIPPSDRPSSAGGATYSTGIIAKVIGQQLPGDFVTYLRKVQKPELVEVGKLHKLRLLLRNERVAWAEDFIRQGGMKEVVGLLHRIMEVEWREEHEDALLHENLLCLKALCTTALALQYLHSIQATLFPAMLNMIFDPEKKGPSEFTTRNIITSVLLTYIESSAPQERVSRAQMVLLYLRDPKEKEHERPLEFVLEMRRERPYRVWNKEVVSVTKEVFWIFLHHLNVIALPAGDQASKGILTTANNGSSAASAAQLSTSSKDTANERYGYMNRHFPQERPPVPAAPYVGGVEWDATNYLASHLDLMNAIIACTPTAAERNQLREQLRISSFERCMGGSLRLCKEKFYSCVHDALRTWVAAAAEDGWDVRDVRFGPSPESRSCSPKKNAVARKKVEEPPKLDMPKLDFALDEPLGGAKAAP